MTTENPVFGKRIVQDGRRGDLNVVNQTTGEVEAKIKRLVKWHPIPSDLLDNLAAVVTKAFPDEFEGTEGQSRENILLESVRQKYPQEQPDEVADRTMVALSVSGFDVHKIANELLTRNPNVQRSLNLGSLTKPEFDKKAKDLRVAIQTFWPSFRYK
jgi:hypothetical protein